MKTITKLTRTFSLFLVLNLLSTAIFAQQPEPNMQGNKGEKIEALRIAFISQQLNLNTQEAQKFWPVYNQYRGDLKTLHQNFKIDANGQMDANQQLDMEQKKLDLKKKYKGQFETCLGKEKVNQLYNLEHKFQDKLKDMREQRQQQKGNGGQNGQRPGGGNGGGRPFGGR